MAYVVDHCRAWEYCANLRLREGTSDARVQLLWRQRLRDRVNAVSDVASCSALLGDLELFVNEVRARRVLPNISQYNVSRLSMCHNYMLCACVFFRIGLAFFE